MLKLIVVLAILVQTNLVLSRSANMSTGVPCGQYAIGNSVCVNEIVIGLGETKVIVGEEIGFAWENASFSGSITSNGSCIRATLVRQPEEFSYQERCDKDIKIIAQRTPRFLSIRAVGLDFDRELVGIEMTEEQDSIERITIKFNEGVITSDELDFQYIYWMKFYKTMMTEGESIIKAAEEFCDVNGSNEKKLAAMTKPLPCDGSELRVFREPMLSENQMMCSHIRDDRLFIYYYGVTVNSAILDTYDVSLKVLNNAVVKPRGQIRVDTPPAALDSAKCAIKVSMIHPRRFKITEE